jgi:outer membrane protein assembly factor BamB
MTTRFLLVTAGICALLLMGTDWPQWRGPNRDGKAVGFAAPTTWPKELSEKWKVPIGDGVATPALVGDKLFVFTRQGDDEIIRCLDAASGKELWQHKYAAAPAEGPAGRFPGPRASPTVANGKVLTVGVRGKLTCLDAASGKVAWEKDDFAGTWPQFFSASSPIVVDGLCIAPLGGRGKGGVVAYDLASGNEKWKWSGDAAAYGSPVLAALNGTKVIITPTERNLVALAAADGKVLWQVMYSQGRYNAASPIIEGQTLVYAGPGEGMSAEKLEKQGAELNAKPLWKNGDNSLIYNTPVLKDGFLYGISTTNALFCVKADTGQTAWTAPLGSPTAAPTAAPKGDQPPAKDQDKGKGFGGKGGKGGRGGGGGGGFGSVVDAGSVLVALTPAGQLVIFQPTATEFKQVASYKVAEEGTYAYPVLSGNRIFIKDRDSVALLMID